MSMNISTSSEDQAMCDINTTPLIDVMLVLLVTLMVSIPVMTHAVKLDMPQPRPDQPPPLVQPEVIELEVDYDGVIVWNGTTVSDVSVLDGYFSQESQKDPQAEIHLRPDRRAKYSAVARVLASAQRHHMKKIGFVNISEFKE